MLVTKFEAARRQLQTAISLWFADADPVSIHTLVFAAHEIIHRAYRLKGFSDLLFDASIIKDEYRSEFVRLVKADANFFKHANIEHIDEAWEFNPEANFLFLFVSCYALNRIGESLEELESAFFFWLRIHKPQYFYEHGVSDNPIDVNTRGDFISLPKPAFLSLFLERRRAAITARVGHKPS